MTLFGWGNPRYFPRLPQPTVRYFDVDHDARVLAHCHWQTQPWERPTILLLHGLNATNMRTAHELIESGRTIGKVVIEF